MRAKTFCSVFRLLALDTPCHSSLWGKQIKSSLESSQRGIVSCFPPLCFLCGQTWYSSTNYTSHQDDLWSLLFNLHRQICSVLIAETFKLHLKGKVLSEGQKEDFVWNWLKAFVQSERILHVHHQRCRVDKYHVWSTYLRVYLRSQQWVFLSCHCESEENRISY